MQANGKWPPAPCLKYLEKRVCPVIFLGPLFVGKQENSWKHLPPLPSPSPLPTPSPPPPPPLLSPTSYPPKKNARTGTSGIWGGQPFTKTVSCTNTQTPNRQMRGSQHLQGCPTVRLPLYEEGILDGHKLMTVYRTSSLKKISLYKFGLNFDNSFSGKFGTIFEKITVANFVFLRNPKCVYNFCFCFNETSRLTIDILMR